MASTAGSHTTHDIVSQVISSGAAALSVPMGSPLLPGEGEVPVEAGRKSVITSQLGAATGSSCVASSF